MKSSAKLSSLLLAIGLVLGVMATPFSTAHAQAVVDTETGEASIELGNTSDTADQSAAAPEADATAANTAADPSDAKPPKDPPKDPREAYRDLVLKDTEEVQGATSAVSRRYKKVDKAAYNEMLQSGAIQPTQ